MKFQHIAALVASTTAYTCNQHHELPSNRVNDSIHVGIGGDMQYVTRNTAIQAEGSGGEVYMPVETDESGVFCQTFDITQLNHYTYISFWNQNVNYSLGNTYPARSMVASSDRPNFYPNITAVVDCNKKVAQFW